MPGDGMLSWWNYYLKDRKDLALKPPCITQEIMNFSSQNIIFRVLLQKLLFAEPRDESVESATSGTIPKMLRFGRKSERFY